MGVAAACARGHLLIAWGERDEAPERASSHADSGVGADAGAGAGAGAGMG